MRFMVSDDSNPSSIISCLRSARENARAVRGSLTTELWETQNQTWLEAQRHIHAHNFLDDPAKLFEWVKFRSHLSRGVTIGTMLKDEARSFMRLGTYLERGDNTARLVDVKYKAIESEFLVKPMAKIKNMTSIIGALSCEALVHLKFTARYTVTSFVQTVWLNY